MTSGCRQKRTVTCGAISPVTARASLRRSSPRATGSISGTAPESATSTAYPGSSPARWDTAGPNSPRPPPNRPKPWVLPAVVLRPPQGHRTGRATGWLCARRPQSDLLHHRWRRGRGSAWKLAKQYFKLTGKPSKYKVISRSIAYHGTLTVRWRSPDCPPSRSRSTDHAGRFPGAQHQLVPGPGPQHRHQGIRAVGGQPDCRSNRIRAPTPSPRYSWSQSRTPAAASRPARIFRAGP